MTSSSDLEQIETRTLSLVRDFSFLHADDPVANSCKAVADAVAQQAVTSSEGGKRLRALLTLDAFRAFAPQDVAERDMDAVLDLACAIEVFQTGALVHDDIIDDSDLRRGKPSAHRALATDTHSDAIGHGLGIMLGDMLATASVDIANKAACRLGSGSSVVSAFLNMHREVEIGQVLDLAVELNTLDDPEELACLIECVPLEDRQLYHYRTFGIRYACRRPRPCGRAQARTGDWIASWFGVPARG